MKLTEEYIKNCAVGVIELKCNRLVRLTDGDNKPISTFVEKGATIEAEKSITNELFVLLKSDSEGFRAYGYIDKEDYDGFEVLNQQINKVINMEHLKQLINYIDNEGLKYILDENSYRLHCIDCPLKAYCDYMSSIGNHDKSCPDIVNDWLMENE